MGLEQWTEDHDLGAHDAVNYFHELQITLSKLDPTPLLAFVTDCEGTLWLCGNGGSASTAQHWACDLSKEAGRRVQALGCNPAVLTAWANDTSYRMALTSELRTLAREGDALLVISCSGASNNLWSALDWAEKQGMARAMLTSDLAPANYLETLTVRVPHTHYGIIEDCHLSIGHWLTEALCGR